MAVANTRQPRRIVDAEFLESLTKTRMPFYLSTVLAVTQSRLAFTFGSDGGGNCYILHHTGKSLGGRADIDQILSLGTILNSERKHVLEWTISPSSQKFLAALTTGGHSKDPFTFTKEFCKVFRGAQFQVRNLVHNISIIKAIHTEPGSANQVIQRHLLNMAVRSRNALVHLLVHWATFRPTMHDGNEPHKLNHFLEKAGVLQWVFTKLSAERWQTEVEGRELRHIYFPRNPTSGLVITFRELRNDALVREQGCVLAGLSPYWQMFGSDLCRTFCLLPDGWNLDDFGPQSSARVLANVTILVPAFPAAVNTAEMVTSLAKHGDIGFAWGIGTGFQPQDQLRLLGTVPKRASVAALSRSVTKSHLLERAFPNFSYDKSREGNMRGAFAQVAAWARKGDRDLSFFQNAVRGTSDVLRAVVKDILEAGDGEMAGAVDKAMNENATREFDVLEQNTAEDDLWSRVGSAGERLKKTRARELLAGKLGDWGGIKNYPINSVRSTLGKDGAELVSALRATKKHIGLSSRIGGWLRTFASTEIQDAVARLLYARVDAGYLAAPVEYEKHELDLYFDQPSTGEPETNKVMAGVAGGGAWSRGDPEEWSMELRLDW